MSDFHSSLRFTSSRDGATKSAVPQNISQWLRAIGEKIGGSIFRVLHDDSMKALSKCDFLKAKILPDFKRVGMFLSGSEGGTCNETKIENLFDGLSLHSLQSLDFQFVVNAQKSTTWAKFSVYATPLEQFLTARDDVINSKTNGNWATGFHIEAFDKDIKTLKLFLTHLGSLEEPKKNYDQQEYEDHWADDDFDDRLDWKDVRKNGKTGKRQIGKGRSCTRSNKESSWDVNRMGDIDDEDDVESIFNPRQKKEFEHLKKSFQNSEAGLDKMDWIAQDALHQGKANDKDFMKKLHQSPAYMASQSLKKRWLKGAHDIGYLIILDQSTGTNIGLNFTHFFPQKWNRINFNLLRPHSSRDFDKDCRVPVTWDKHKAKIVIFGKLLRTIFSDEFATGVVNFLITEGGDMYSENVSHDDQYTQLVGAVDSPSSNSRPYKRDCSKTQKRNKSCHHETIAILGVYL